MTRAERGAKRRLGSLGEEETAREELGEEEEEEEETAREEENVRSNPWDERSRILTPFPLPSTPLPSRLRAGRKIIRSDPRGERLAIPPPRSPGAAKKGGGA